MIESSGFGKQFGNVQVLEDVSIHIRSGASVGLLGPNGAGKTTLLRILSTYMLPSSGSITVCHQDLLEHPMSCRRRTGYLPESVPLYEDMTPTSYLRYRGRLKGMSRSDRKERQETLMNQFELHDHASRTIANLSKGYRKRLGLADALLSEPDLVLLDEPTEGLDPNQVARTRELIADLHDETTLLLSSHLVNDIREVCERVLIIHRGKLVFDDDLPVRSSTDEECRMILEVKGDKHDLRHELEEISGVTDLERSEMEGGYHQFELFAQKDLRERIVEICTKNGWSVRDVHLERPSLEDIFARKTTS